MKGIISDDNKNAGQPKHWPWATPTDPTLHLHCLALPSCHASGPEVPCAACPSPCGSPPLKLLLPESAQTPLQGPEAAHLARQALSMYLASMELTTHGPYH